MYLIHGMTHTPEHGVWKNMIQRCTNPNVPGYERYGGRGIKLCERWIQNFKNFFDDMGPRPSAKHSIDRKDNDGPYCKDNCRWATKKEQQNNLRTNRWITHKGLTMTISDWHKKLGMKPGTIQNILKRGYTMEKALDKPVGRYANYETTGEWDHENWKRKPKDRFFD